MADETVPYEVIENSSTSVKNRITAKLLSRPTSKPPRKDNPNGPSRDPRTAPLWAGLAAQQQQRPQLLPDRGPEFRPGPSAGPLVIANTQVPPKPVQKPNPRWRRASSITWLIGPNQ